MIMMQKKKQVLSQILGPAKEEVGEGEPSLHSCMRELIEAVHSRDLEGACGALKACLAEIGSEPQVEE